MFDKKSVQLVQLGALQEQGVLLKTSSLFDGVVIKANLAMSFPGATYSFLQRISRKFLIDPVTYIFALDPKYLYSENNKLPKEVYSELATAYSEKFDRNLKNGKATDISSLTEDDIRNLASNVLRFQKECFSRVTKDDFFNRLLEEIIDVSPLFCVAPYFAHNVKNFDICSKVNISLLENALRIDPNVAGIITLTLEMLESHELLIGLANRYLSTGGNIFIFWVDDMDEINLTDEALKNLISFILLMKSKGKVIINLYGGYLSALLTKIGLDGFSHGPGYSERRAFIPVQGMTPSPMYYFLPFHQRCKVDGLFDIFRKIKKYEFRKRVCDCAICSRLLEEEQSIVAGMISFMEIIKRIPYKVRTRSGRLVERVKVIYSKRSHQLARYHYILSKNKEFSQIKEFNWREIVNQLEEDMGFFRDIIPDISPIKNWLHFTSLIQSAGVNKKSTRTT